MICTIIADDKGIKLILEEIKRSCSYSGIEISEVDFSRVFECFYRVDKVLSKAPAVHNGMMFIVRHNRDIRK